MHKIELLRETEPILLQFNISTEKMGVGREAPPTKKKGGGDEE